MAPEEGLAALLDDLAAYFPPPKAPKAPKAPQAPKGPRQPGRAHDLMRLGVRPSELARFGSKAVYGALVSTAMSFLQANLLWEDWFGYLDGSRLGQQALLDSRLRPLNSKAFLRQLRRAWARAEANIAEDPPFTHDDVVARALALLDAVAAAPWSATRSPADKIVYMFTIAEAARRGFTHPTLSGRTVSEGTGVPHRTCARSLLRLVDAGLLRLESKGARTRRPEHRIGILDTAAPGVSVGSGVATIYTVMALTRPSRQAVARLGEQSGT